MRFIYVHPGTVADARAYAKRRGIPAAFILSARQVHNAALHGRVSRAIILDAAGFVPTAKLRDAVRDHNHIALATSRKVAADYRAQIARTYGLPVAMLKTESEAGE